MARTLVIDDEEAVRTLVTRMLSRVGQRSTRRLRGARACEAA